MTHAANCLETEQLKCTKGKEKGVDTCVLFCFTAFPEQLRSLALRACSWIEYKSRGVPPGGHLVGCRWRRCPSPSSADWSCWTSVCTAHRPDRTADSPRWTQSARMRQTPRRQLRGGGGGRWVGLASPCNVTLRMLHPHTHTQSLGPNKTKTNTQV